MLPFIVPIGEYRMAILAVRSGGVVSVTVLDQAALDVGLTAEVGREDGEAVVLLYEQPPEAYRLKAGKLRPAQSPAEGGSGLPSTEVVFFADPSSGTLAWQPGEVPAWLASLVFPALPKACPGLKEVGKIQLPPSEVWGVDLLARRSDGRFLIATTASVGIPGTMVRLYTLTASSASGRSTFAMTSSLSEPGYTFGGFEELDGRGWLASTKGQLFPFDLDTGRIGEASPIDLGAAPTALAEDPSGLVAVSGNGCAARLLHGQGTWTLVPGTERLCQAEIEYVSDERQPPQVLSLSATAFLATGWSREHSNEVLHVEGEEVTYECFDDGSLLVVQSIGRGGDGALRGYGKLQAAERALYRYTPGGACPWKRVLHLSDLIALNARIQPYPEGNGVLFASAHGNVGVIEDEYVCPMLQVSGVNPDGWADLQWLVRLDAFHYLAASNRRNHLWIIRIQ